MTGKTLRPIDEIPAGAVLAVRRNQAMTWLVERRSDQAGGQEEIGYLPPGWLVALIDLAEQAGFVAAQAAVREALGITLIPGGRRCALEPTPVKLETPAAVAELACDSESNETEHHPNMQDRSSQRGDQGGLS